MSSKKTHPLNDQKQSFRCHHRNNGRLHKLNNRRRFYPASPCMKTRHRSSVNVSNDENILGASPESSNDRVEQASTASIGPVERIDSQMKEIPGYYYDPTKKRYFKIPKEHSGLSLPKYRSVEDSGHCTSAINRKKSGSGVYRCILERQCCANYPALFRRKALEEIVRQMEIKQSLKLDPFVSSDVPRTKVSPTRLESDLRSQRLLTVFSCSGYTSSANIVLFSDVRKDENNKISLKANMSMMKTQTTTALLWSPHQDSSSFYTLSLLGYGNNPGEVLLFRVNGRTQRLAGRFPVRGRSVWTTQWNRNPLFNNIISIGASKAALTFDVSTKRQMVFASSPGDVMAQEFSTQSPLLFNGSREGTVRSMDIRLKPSLPAIRVTHGPLASITCIRMMNDENYMVSSALGDTIKRWDLRMSRCVQDYTGHVNTITHSLPFHIDSTNTLLFAGGEDSVTRVWSVQSGELLHTVPFPKTADRTVGSIPALRYAEEWGGPGGLPGLMYGTEDTISLFRL